MLFSAARSFGMVRTAAKAFATRLSLGQRGAVATEYAVLIAFAVATIAFGAVVFGEDLSAFLANLVSDIGGAPGFPD